MCPFKQAKKLDKMLLELYDKALKNNEFEIVKPDHPGLPQFTPNILKVWKTGYWREILNNGEGRDYWHRNLKEGYFTLTEEMLHLFDEDFDSHRVIL